MIKPKEFADWLTPLEAARKVGVTDRNIMYYIRNQKITAVKVGYRWLIDPESLRQVFDRS
jgi:excisionase family DNA binding protein